MSSNDGKQIQGQHIMSKFLKCLLLRAAGPPLLVGPENAGLTLSRGQVSQDWSWGKIMELVRTPLNELLTPDYLSQHAGKVSGKLGKAEKGRRRQGERGRGREG